MTRNINTPNEDDNWGALHPHRALSNPQASRPAQKCKSVMPGNLSPAKPNYGKGKAIT